jgi:starch synthase
MKIAFAASESAPFCRTGGLGDVIGALPQALSGCEVGVFLPLHRSVERWRRATGAELRDTEVDFEVPLLGDNIRGRLRELVDDSSVRTFFVDCPRFFDRGALYGYDDDALRYAFFSRAVLRVAAAAMDGPPDIVHAHDWMAALVPVYLQAREQARLPNTRCVFTIHNLLYQGRLPKELLPDLDLGWDLFRYDNLEFFDRINLMKGAITAADAVTTVSRSYAAEILTPAFGEDLDPHLQAHQEKLSGILNGLDIDLWNPATDSTIAATYTDLDLGGKAECKQSLLKEFGLEGDGPLIGVVSRFTAQKGLDLVCELAPELAASRARLIVLGTGDVALEGRFRALARTHASSVGVRIDFDDDLARRIIAGSDILLVPSRFEPCGLTQLQAMRYGTVPVVHAVGGLRDTVDDPGSGFRFENPTADGLSWALRRAIRAWRDEPERWMQLQRRIMRRDLSWGPRAAEYVELYRRVLA